MDEPAFKQVSKGLFKDIYFRLGGGKASGWTADYWQELFEDKDDLGWRYLVEEPRSAEHTQMCIVSDEKTWEHRLFFVTEKSADDLFEWPSYD